VDFDGDCMPDLFLTRQTGSQADKSSMTVDSYYEIYIQQSIVNAEGIAEQKYCLTNQNGRIIKSKGQQQSVSNDMPLMEIIDINRDGMNDLAFVDPNTQELTVLYNKLEAADTKAENLCL